MTFFERELKYDFVKCECKIKIKYVKTEENLSN